MDARGIAQRVRAWPYWPLVGFVVAIKVLLFVHGSLSYLTPWNVRFQDAHELLEVWNRWDSLNYLHIAEFGYQGAGEKRHLLAFYPLFPALIRMLEPLCGSFLLAGFWISTVASLAAAGLFHRLATLDHPEDARRAVFFLFVFPTSYALHIPYTESLFLAITFASLLCARSRRWALAGLLGAAAALTRINGIALAPALALEAFAQYRAERRFRAEWLFLALAPLGALGYLLVNVWVTGHPFAFVQYQHEHFKRTVDWPWNGYLSMWTTLLRHASADAFVLRFEELLFACVMLAGTVASFFRLRASYTAWMVTNAVLVLSFTYPWSVPRYTLILFPLFLLMARAGRRPIPFALMTVWSLLSLAFFTSLFVRGFWAF